MLEMATSPLMVKYKIEPRFATFVYDDRALSISTDVTAAADKDSPISIDFVFAVFSVLISSSLSKMDPFEFASSRSSVSSSVFKIWRLSLICCTKAERCASRSGRSKPTTTFRSCAASPSSVITQLTMDTFPITSGVYEGFESLVHRLSWKVGETSSSLSPSCSIFCPDTMVYAFSKTGSIIGSSSSSRFSNRNGLPYVIASSRNLM
mmetsp:Transcript_26219/g.66036  ORF Transcript_26219/g.66036 Transcript_26219/m.66036 type:complete len:207 (-) Transcript_26219:962-1582(-)